MALSGITSAKQNFLIIGKEKNLVASPLLYQMAKGNLQTKAGIFKVLVFSDGQVEATALQTLELDISLTVPLKVQSTCITGHYFNSIECDCKEDSDIFQNYMSTYGNGLLVLLNQEGRANGNVAHIASQDLKENGVTQDEAYIQLGFLKDSRDYSIVPKILSNLGVRNCLLHSQSESKLEALQKSDINCNIFA